MKKITRLLQLVGLIQISLGIGYLFAPDVLLGAMGHSLPAPDIHYPLAMLAARFIAYGIALIYIAKAPAQHRLWILFMVLIQIIDLSAGLYYTLIGIVDLALSGFPMFNAAWISVLLLLWLPKQQTA